MGSCYFLIGRWFDMKGQLLKWTVQTTKVLHVHRHTWTCEYIPSIMKLFQFFFQSVSCLFAAAILQWHLLEKLSGATDSSPAVAACQCLILRQQNTAFLMYIIFLISLSFSLGQPMLIITVDNTARLVSLPPLLLLKWRCKWDLETTTV